MSAPNTSTNNTAPNPSAPQAQSNRPNQGSKKTKKTKSAPYTSKPRSANPLPNDPNTARIQSRLASGGTALDIAEEAYRLCHLNASLRSDLAATKASSLAAPLDTDADTARIKTRLDTNATAREIADEAYHVCRVNAHVRSDRNRAQAELREARKKVAVKDDALGEMRPEYVKMRRMLERAMGLLKSRKIDVPEEFGRGYDDVMELDMHDWQGRKGVKKWLKKKEAEAKGKGKKKENLKDTEKKGPEKMPFLLHVETGRKYDMSKPLADQDSDGGGSEQEPEPELPVVSKKKRKGGDMEGPMAKKARTDDLEEGEIVE